MPLPSAPTHVSLLPRLERATGFPAWSMVGVVGGLVVLGVAMVGLYWDVAWHVDHGRDEELFTAPHVLILVGLVGLVATAVVASALATLEQAPVGLRIGRVRVPWSALLIVVFRLGGTVAFFVDDLWHRAYGLDVTLWSPPHLVLLANGSLSALALWLMVVEALPSARPTRLGTAVYVVACGSMLVGVSTFQAEFDFGVSQFRQLSLPVLIAAAGVFVLTLSRLALGPGGAVAAAGTFLVLRGAVALLVAGLGHTVPRPPLYLPTAIAVEVVAWYAGTKRPMRFALLVGAVGGSVALAGEWAWEVAVGGNALPVAAWPSALALAVAASGGAAVLAVGLARTVLDGDSVSRPPLVGAAVVVVAALAFPVPRDVGHVDAHIALDRLDGRATVTVRLHPPDAARSATQFDVVAVQGGGKVRADLEEVERGHYVSSRPVPVAGRWKSLVRLERANQVMAAPIYLPPDPAVDAPASTAAPERRVAFGSITEVLQREAHDGPAWPALVAYAALAAVIAVWLGLLARATSRLRRRAPAPAR